MKKKMNVSPQVEVAANRDEDEEEVLEMQESGTKKSMRHTVVQTSTAVVCFSCRIFKWLIIISLILAVLVGVGLAIWIYVLRDEQEAELASCGDCHCIPGDHNVCPRAPPTDFPEDLIASLEAQTALNPYTLDCDPYVDNYVNEDTQVLCETNPPQIYTELKENAVCGIHYQDTNCSLYELKTYPSWEDATDAGAFVTHLGSCGVCSTTQDLAAYMSTFDLTSATTNCAKDIVGGFTLKKLDCLMNDIGFTEDCAKIWLYNLGKTFE
jgi:hypothetical protein